MASQEYLPSRPRITQNQTTIPNCPSPSQYGCLRAEKRERLHSLKSFGRSPFNVSFPASTSIPYYYTISTTSPRSAQERRIYSTSECRAIIPVWSITAVIKVQIAADDFFDIREGKQQEHRDCIARKYCPYYH
jgi:hypothetical protein